MSYCIGILRVFLYASIATMEVHSLIYLSLTKYDWSTQYYDCLIYASMTYCRRQLPSMERQSNEKSFVCENQGIRHDFQELRENNTSAYEILHKWKSSIDKVEDYLIYLKNDSQANFGYICECINPISFGVYCEYSLVNKDTLVNSILWSQEMRRYNPDHNQLFGTTSCYETVDCDSGMLCLDWRNICDGIQQCMSGLDEIPCIHLEFNECESDEYRCTNGMCIPSEYFLDGALDCLDWSDEISFYDDSSCPIENSSSLCDDRICPVAYWSCGDGQCIPNRFSFQTGDTLKSECRSRREQYFMCETHHSPRWTLSSGRCVGNNPEILVFDNQTIDDTEQCEYYLRCALSRGLGIGCDCQEQTTCAGYLNSICKQSSIIYPKRGIITPYILTGYSKSLNFKRNFSFLWINGTILCNHTVGVLNGSRFSYFTTLLRIEDVLCLWVKNTSNSSFQLQRSNFVIDYFWLWNRSMNDTFQCQTSGKWISIHRVLDGFDNCGDRSDELLNSNLGIQIPDAFKRYRLRCSPEKQLYLPVSFLGGSKMNCENGIDQYFLGTGIKLNDLQCDIESKSDCQMLYRYIIDSWSYSSNTSVVHNEKVIPFWSYCNTFWNLASKEDENLEKCQYWMCPESQWQCLNGQCIEKKWIFNDHWDCADGSDEIDALFEQSNKRRNQSLVGFFEREQRNTSRSWRIPFKKVCDLSRQYPCLTKNTTVGYCIDLNQIGDGIADCLGSIDERNVRGLCNKKTMLGYHFQCTSSNESQCIPYYKHCSNAEYRCNNKTEDELWCERIPSNTSLSASQDFLCFNGTYVSKGRCNDKADCSMGEDEYMCERLSSSYLTAYSYREEAESNTLSSPKMIDSIYYPILNDNKVTNGNNSVRTIDKLKYNATLNDSAAFLCNRGLPFYSTNSESVVCFCPPQYYGQKCEFHSDRLIFTYHLNLSESIYNADSDQQIVLKFVVSFLYEDTILMSHVSHIRPAFEFNNGKKKVDHFVYSRSELDLKLKKQRFFNQTDIIYNRPFSIRIECYERKNLGQPKIIAVWRFFVPFDYLPVSKLSTILRLNDRKTMSKDPCSRNPCHENQICQPVLNERDGFVCLCKPNFEGENCSIENQLCLHGYCDGASLCKPNYRGILLGNHFPFCICSYNRYGERCYIEYDRCQSNPCQNGGSCYPTFRPDDTFCRCTRLFYGKFCQHQIFQVELIIQENLVYKGATIQFLKINKKKLDLILVSQKFYRKIPSRIFYEPEKDQIPEMILAKIYSVEIDNPPNIYLVRFQTNVVSNSTRTSLTNENRCYSLKELNINVDSPIYYHQVCQNQTNFFCFHDDNYVCVCREDRRRAECFTYDFNVEKCSSCLSSGRCLKQWPFSTSKDAEFHCLCPPCHSGDRCQFDSNSFSITLDQIFYTDLIDDQFNITKVLIWIVPIIFFLLALPNNICSIVTFSQTSCVATNVGVYLLSMSIINQLNLFFLWARASHLYIHLTFFTNYHWINNYLCKILNFSLLSTSQMIYWFSSLVVGERLYVTLFLNGHRIQRPKLAYRLVFFLITVNFTTNAHELIFMESWFGGDLKRHGICIFQYPNQNQSFWKIYHFSVSVINFIVPIFINFFATIIIITIVIKKKLKAQKKIRKLKFFNKTKSRFLHLFTLLAEQKELLVGPGITLIPQLCSLPSFIVSFASHCIMTENSGVRYVVVLFQLVTFVPQVISFILYVIPSSFYSNEWRRTSLYRNISNRWLKSRSNQRATVFTESCRLSPTY